MTESNSFSLAALRFFENSRILALVHRLVRPFRGGEGYPDNAKLSARRDVIERVLMAYKKQIDDYGGRFIVVYLPVSRFYFKEWPDCERQAVSEICSNLKIDFVDLVVAFTRHVDPKIFFAHNPYAPMQGGHCNREGYRLIATELKNILLHGGGG
jgi:lysophospholipase L1-like esterase